MTMTSSSTEILQIQPLTHADFAPFGQVIETNQNSSYSVNDGTALRFHDLAWVDASEDHGRPCVGIFRAQPRQLPLELTLLERHPLSSQAFVPMARSRFLVIVAAAGDQPMQPRAFISNGAQGINYHRGTWHHPLVALDAESDFLVIDRSGPGENCDEFKLAIKLAIPELDEAP